MSCLDVQSAQSGLSRRLPPLDLQAGLPLVGRLVGCNLGL